jgi:hypothetical protein
VQTNQPRSRATFRDGDHQIVLLHSGFGGFGEKDIDEMLEEKI